MATPGTVSGTTNFLLTNGGVVVEAFHRLGIHSPELIRQHLLDARVSLNLELQRMSSPARGLNLWKVNYGQTLTLVVGQATYVLTPDVLAITEMWFRTVNGNGTGLPSDRIMTPLTRQQYSDIPNKLTNGLPNQYWFERLTIPQVTIWQPPSIAAPDYTVVYNTLTKIDDAGLGSGEIPDVVYRGLDVLCARLALRLMPKVLPRSEWATIRPMLKEDAQEAQDDFVADDQETGPMIITPNVAGYGRI